MKTKINTYIQIYLNNIELNIAVQENLKGEEDRLKNFGWFEISDGTIDAETCSWDNLDFFNGVSFELFKNECKDDLKRCGFSAKKVYKDINKLLKRAKKLKLINFENE